MPTDTGTMSFCTCSVMRGFASNSATNSSRRGGIALIKRMLDQLGFDQAWAAAGLP